MILGSHQHERTAHKHQRQARQCVDGTIPIRGLNRDGLDVEGHRDEYQSGKRHRARTDQEKEITPLP